MSQDLNCFCLFMCCQRLMKVVLQCENQDALRSALRRPATSQNNAGSKHPDRPRSVFRQLTMTWPSMTRNTTKHSRFHENDTRIRVDRFGGPLFTFGDGASSKATSLSRLQVRNDALGDFWVLVRRFSDQPKPTPLMLGVEFLKEDRCVVNHGEESNFQCSLSVDGHCLRRVAVCAPCHFAVSIGSFHHKHKQIAPRTE